MKTLRLDFESYSEAALSGEKSVGVWNYWCHPSTEILMLGYKIGKNGERKLWFPHLGPMPTELKDALLNPEYRIYAFNSAFERYGLWHKCGMNIPASRFEDPQVGARYLSMPGGLGEVSTILDLPEELAKDKRGEELIKLFCEPHEHKKKKGEPAGGKYRNNWDTHPAEWKEFSNYCIQDLVAEEEVNRREEILGAMPLPPFERKLWEFDQLVNDRGMPVDVDFVRKAYNLAVRSKGEAKKNFEKLTGVLNANSPEQVKKWARTQGYPFNTLRKETVDSVLKDPEVMLTPACREALTLRREASSTSYQKLSAILRQVSPDGMLRGQFIFMGSARCGRWAGNAVQLHNLARPGLLGKTDTFPGHDFEDQKVVREARDLIYAEDYEGIKNKYGSVLLTVKNVIRTVFVAHGGAC